MRSEFSIPRVRLLVLGLALLTTFSPPAHADPTQRDDTAHRIDTYLQRLVPFGFWGTVLIARHGQVVLNQGYGWADAGRQIPNSADTVFPIESVSKQFTAAAIMTLEMQGRLKTSDPITRFFDDVPSDKVDVTIHHLLSHTSGIITGTEEYYSDTSKDGIIGVALKSPLKFEPGERDAYSNIGYALLAAIVEKASGMSFANYLQRMLFTPAGMNHTGSQPESDWPLAHRYARGADNGTSLDGTHPDWNHVGSGDVVSTTGDLFRWHQALLGTNILSEDAKHAMYTPVANGYGYGWYISDSGHGRLVEHDGGSSKGTAADFRRYLDEDLVIIVLANNDGETMLFSARLRDNIRDLAFGGSRPLPPAVTSATVPSADFTGTYRFDDGSSLDIERTGDLVEIAGTGQTAVSALLAMSDGEAASHAEVSNRTTRILEGVRGHDMNPLREATPERLGRQLEAMFDDLGKALGDVTGYSILGTVPPTGVDGADYMTLFRVDYGNNAQAFRFYWSDGKIIALGGAGMREPVRIRAVASSNTEFVGYHVATGRSCNLTFQRDGQNRVTGVTSGRYHFQATLRRLE